MTDAGTTQRLFLKICPEPPVEGLPISQDRLDGMKLVRNRSRPLNLPSGKDILADRISKMYNNIDTKQTRSVSASISFGMGFIPWLPTNRD